MRIRFWIGFLFAISSFGLYAQSLSDTIQIGEVVTYGSYKKFQAGAKIEALLPEQISSIQEGGIEQLLMRFTPIYVKSNAGGLATIHIRGTAADHTSIMFGGINVNSLTLGHSNLSNITSFLFDKMEIQYGSSSALNGSGAIGGAIYLGEKNNWTKGVRTDFKYSSGSFGERLYGTKIYTGNGKWESVTKLLNYKSDNNFTYVDEQKFSPTFGQKITQHGATIDNKGLIQQFNYLFGPNEYLKSMIWYTNNWHEIQPPIGETSQVVTVLKDNNIRFWGEYRNEKHPLKYSTGIGYVFDNEIYNNDPGQLIQTNRFIANISLKQSIKKHMEYETGTKYKYIVPNVYSYSHSANLNEHNAEFYFTWFYQPVQQLKTTVNLRQQVVSNYKAPFTPAFGLDYNWLNKEKNNLVSTLNLSKSYRIPTFNDRYWPTSINPLGTPGLKPEDGLSIDGGLKYIYQSSKIKSNLKLNAFYMNIKNWLEWRNNNGPIPVNLDKVISKGIELHADVQLKTNKITSTLSANYTYNPSTKIESDKPDQQLIYIPLNMANAYYSLEYGSFSFSVDASYTGKRYYAYISKATQKRKSLAPYFLTNCNVSYGFKIKNQDFVCAFSANNLFDVSYQNQLNYAMPGINFRASIRMNININNNN